MKADKRFNNLDNSFWGNIKFIGDRLKYSKKNNF